MRYYTSVLYVVHDVIERINPLLAALTWRSEPPLVQHLALVQGCISDNEFQLELTSR